jgi:hypothetical protein
MTSEDEIECIQELIIDACYKSLHGGSFDIQDLAGEVERVRPSSDVFIHAANYISVIHARVGITAYWEFAARQIPSSPYFDRLSTGFDKGGGEAGDFCFDFASAPT